MPNIEAEIHEIRKYFVTWITEVSTSNALTYYDINKISEGTCLRLLNLLFDCQLEDLNEKKRNYPGIDLGDTEKAKLAFQITSRTDTNKFKDSLANFLRNNYEQDYPNGIKFLVISNHRRPKIRQADLEQYVRFFNVTTDILFPTDLIKIIEGLYYSNETKFYEIKNFLSREFGSPQKKSVLNFKNASEKISFYKRQFIAENKSLSEKFVPFQCTIGNEIISTAELPENLFDGNSILITGPSGCGKSIFARQLGLHFLNTGITIILEAKYYDDKLDLWIDQQIQPYGFDSSTDFFLIARNEQLPVLFIVDGLNEGGISKIPQIILTLEKLKEDFGIKVLITRQVDEGIHTSDLIRIKVDHPSFETKKLIAASYSGKGAIEKLDPILSAVSTSLEAKMVGEIGTEAIEKLSRFALFEHFLDRKLGSFKADGFTLLSQTAKLLSENIAYSLPERDVEKIQRSQSLSPEIYRQCISSKLLEKNFGKVSFNHEMFFNFFVAESIVRSAHDSQNIIQEINEPRNYDKKLLIIGAIGDLIVLDEVLSSLTDDELLLSMYLGDGGVYCQQWVERQLKDILSKIEQELLGLEYQLNDNSSFGMDFRQDSLFNWTHHQLALIHTVPMLLVKENFITEVFELVSVAEQRRKLAVSEFIRVGKNLRGSFGSSTFSTTYVGIISKKPAINRIFSDLQSGFVTFRNPATIKDETVRRLLSKTPINDGHCYLLLLLLRYENTLNLLYPYVEHTLKYRWKSAPYHLINEILTQIRHFPATSEQREELIDALNTMMSESQNPFFSTIIFDALDSLGALDIEADEHTESVLSQIAELLTHQDDENYWQMAAGVYIAQFDHPYSSAYFTAINGLNNMDKSNFYKMALQGIDSGLFTSSLILESTKLLKEHVCPYLVRWIQEPFAETIFLHDCVKIFFLSHVILGKHNFPIESKFNRKIDDKDKSLHATAEIYYWINRTDLEFEQRKERCKSSAKFLFDLENPYTIDSIWQAQQGIMHSDTFSIFEASPIVFISDVLKDYIINVCRHNLKNIGFQKGILTFDGPEQINEHAITMISNLGSIIDIDVLRPLTSHPRYGRSAVEVIKKLKNEVNC